VAELVVALDVDSNAEALRVVDQLPDLGWVKIGPVLFVREGPQLVRLLKQRGLRVFLDLKWHDIPNTVAAAVGAAGELGVDLATVHALGGEAMLMAARAACGNDMRLVAVTVLTSHSPREYWATMGNSGANEVSGETVRLARLALDAGVHGVVTSPLEIAAIREVLGAEPLIVVPGIRPAGSATDDQRRTADPASAVADGATHLVVGRPITRAENPAEVYQSIRRESRCVG
jgi:orotidine-5'-phosphate decarboxylase